MKNVVLGLLSLTTLGLLTVPTFAGEPEAPEVSGDEVIMQDSQQSVYQDGSRNRATQESSQMHNQTNKKKPTTGSRGSVQTNYQDGAQFGEHNTFQQRNEQRTRIGGGSKKTR